jgi:hypothetical protein
MKGPRPDRIPVYGAGFTENGPLDMNDYFSAFPN